MKTRLVIVALVALVLSGCSVQAATKPPTCPPIPTCVPTPTLLIREVTIVVTQVVTRHVTRLVTVIVTPTFTPTPTSTPTSTPTLTATPTVTPTPWPDAPEGETVEAKVVSVVDGDTIRVMIDGTEYPVRYIGIDCPETKHPSKPATATGKAASAANADLVGGMTVLLERDASPTDRYDRLLAYVWVGDVMVNEELVRLGWAESKAYPPDTKYQKRFDSAEQAARLARRGMWAVEVVPTPTPKARKAIGGGVVISDLDKGEEYVEIENTGTEPVNLSRWRLLSERGDQWFWFPDDDVILGAGETIRVYSGPGAADKAARDGDLFWTEKHVWSNSRKDDARLLNQQAMPVDEWID